MAHALRNDTIEILGDLIAFPSISQQSNLELIAYLNGRLDQIGARTFLTLDPGGAKANLFATIGPREWRSDKECARVNPRFVTETGHDAQATL